MAQLLVVAVNAQLILPRKWLVSFLCVFVTDVCTLMLFILQSHFRILSSSNAQSEDTSFSMKLQEATQ